MIYSIYGLHINVESILNDFGQGAKGSTTYVPQLAQHLVEHGLYTNLVTSGSKIAPLSWKQLSRPALVDRLRHWLDVHPEDSYYKNNSYLLDYLHSNGNLTITPYDTGTWKAMLDEGSTILLCVDEALLWGDRLYRTESVIEFNSVQGSVEGHFVIVTEYTGSTFHVTDPFPTGLPGRHGTYDIDEKQLLNASLSWSPQFIEIQG